MAPQCSCQYRGATGMRWAEDDESVPAAGSEPPDMELAFELVTDDGVADEWPEGRLEGETSSGQSTEARVVEEEIRSGVKDESALTDAAFMARHPERNGRPLQAGEPNAKVLTQEWLSIRDTLVRPALMSVELGVKVAPCVMAAGSSITINPGVVCTSAIKKVLDDMEPHFRRAGVRVVVTSGVRSSQHQLNIIKRKAKQFGLDKKYPSIRSATVDDVESWRKAWDELLNRHNYIVNPPKSARSDIRNKVYHPSPHIRGRAFDLSGAPIATIESIAKRFRQAGGGSRQILPEPVNRAVHIGLK